MDGTRGSSSPLSPGTKRMACSFGRTRWTGGAIARAAAESGASSGTAAKCELCLTTQWCGPPTIYIYIYIYMYIYILSVYILSVYFFPFFLYIYIHIYIYIYIYIYILSVYIMSVYFFYFFVMDSPRRPSAAGGYSETLAGGQPGPAKAAPPAAFDMAARSSGSCEGCGNTGQPQRLDVKDNAGNPGACRVTCMQTACVLSCIVSCIVLCKLLYNVSCIVQRGAFNRRARAARQRGRGGPGRQGAGQERWGECALQHVCKLLA